MRSIKKVVIEHDMILKNDTLLLRISRGKDTLSSLHISKCFKLRPSCLKMNPKILKVLAIDIWSSSYGPSSPPVVQYLGG
mmetsp:Transcript_1192/g.1588  ORF Transcript_1192/g.1588 Transcript_1192/m.1588 type:complete len:80 (+) Transcript_1192:5948-6187(+)